MDPSYGFRVVDGMSWIQNSGSRSIYSRSRVDTWSWIHFDPEYQVPWILHEESTIVSIRIKNTVVVLKSAKPSDEPIAVLGMFSRNSALGLEEVFPSDEIKSRSICDTDPGSRRRSHVINDAPIYRAGSRSNNKLDPSPGYLRTNIPLQLVIFFKSLSRVIFFKACHPSYLWFENR